MMIVNITLVSDADASERIWWHRVHACSCALNSASVVDALFWSCTVVSDELFLTDSQNTDQRVGGGVHHGHEGLEEADVEWLRKVKESGGLRLVEEPRHLCRARVCEQERHMQQGLV